MTLMQMDPILYYNLITNCPARLSLMCRLGNVLTDIDRFTVSLSQFIREASEHAHVHIYAAISHPAWLLIPLIWPNTVATMSGVILTFHSHFFLILVDDITCFCQNV